MNFSSIKVDNTSVNVSHFCHNSLTMLRHFATCNSLLISPATCIINYGTLCTFVDRSKGAWNVIVASRQIHTAQIRAFTFIRKTHPDPSPSFAISQEEGEHRNWITENVLFVAEYAQKWEQLLVQQRDILNAAIDQVSQFRGQLLQEEQISQKMTRTRNLRYN